MTLISIALFFMLLVAAKVVRKQHRQLKDARAKLARLAATDNEIVCLLEATDTPLAKRLLLEAREPEQQMLSPNRAVLKPADWKSFRREMTARTSSEARIKVLRQWVRQGALFTSSQRASIMEMPRSEYHRDTATRILDRQ